MSLTNSKLEDFVVVGINHWKAPVQVRECFSLTEGQRENLLDEAREIGLDNLIVLSTCNRTELFGITPDEKQFEDLLVRHTKGDIETFKSYGFALHGEKAVQHLYRVTVGLDAQILGDLQIVKQVKEAYEASKSYNLVEGELHRLFQSIFRTHKRVRTETDLGYGAASVAYAAVQFARRHIDNWQEKNILLLGTGKIGKVTCKNLVGLGASQLTLINRNKERADDLADRYSLTVSGFENLVDEVSRADLILVATGAPHPILNKSHFPTNGQAHRQVLLDLSVPRNVDTDVEELEQVQLVNMDQLNDATDESFRIREQSVPAAEAIIADEFNAYLDWLSEQKVVPTIVALTRKLNEIRDEELERYRHQFPEEVVGRLELVTHRIVNRIAAHSIDHLKANKESPEELTRMVQSMFKLEKESDID